MLKKILVAYTKIVLKNHSLQIDCGSPVVGWIKLDRGFRSVSCVFVLGVRVKGQQLIKTSWRLSLIMKVHLKPESSCAVSSNISLAPARHVAKSNNYRAEKNILCLLRGIPKSHGDKEHKCVILSQ